MLNYLVFGLMVPLTLWGLGTEHYLGTFFILFFINPYWIGRTYMPLLGKGLEGHICPTIMTSRWHHCGVVQIFMNLVVQTFLLHCGQGDMSF